MQITTIGLDLAKNVFQLHAVDATDDIVLRKRLRRAQVLAFFAALPRCVVGLEACGSAHFWARELIALGHEVRIICQPALKRDPLSAPKRDPLRWLGETRLTRRRF